MITGTITNLRSHIELFIQGNGIQARAEFTIDTGYNGTLTLPLADCLSLGLTRRGSRRSLLADGSHVRLEMYRLIVSWDGRDREVEILAVGQERLLGATGSLSGRRPVPDDAAWVLGTAVDHVLYSP